MTVDIKVIHAFSIGQTGGNPAGVVLNADGLDYATRQRIAALAGFPETAFVSASEKADFKLEFYTPVKQIAHCGHATIATFSYLKQMGRINGDQSSKETIDGIRSIFFRDGQAFMEQNPPVFSPVGSLMDEVLASLRITREGMYKGLTPMIGDTGNAFLLVPVSDINTLASIRPDQEMIYRVSEKLGLIGYYAFTIGNGTKADATTRMFAPLYSIPEEAGTGMAAGPLASYLYEVCGIHKNRFVIEQGRYMTPASTSQIQVELELQHGTIASVYAGGAARIAREIHITI